MKESFVPSRSSMTSMMADCASCFFFQAEDGIRGADVTGVQTCALPISVVQPAPQASQDERENEMVGSPALIIPEFPLIDQKPFFKRLMKRVRFLASEALTAQRSEERRVGKECRALELPYHI